MRKINSNLSSLFWIQFFGALNDNIFKNSLVILITFQGTILFGLSSPMLVALAGAIFIGPFFFLSATAGQLADVYDKTLLVKIIKQVEIAIVVVAILGFYFESFHILFLVLFLLGVHSTFFGPLKYALIPYYSFKKDLVFSNALISGGTFVAILMGTIIGGISKGYILKFILLIFAILGLYFSRRLPPLGNAQKGHDVTVDWHFYRSTKNILELIFKNHEISVLALGLSWFWFMGAGLLSLLPILAKDLIHGNAAVATLLLFVFTLGMGVGPFVLDLLTGGVVKKFVIPLSLVLMSMFIFDTAFVVRTMNDIQNNITMDQFFSIGHALRLLIDLFFLSFFGGMYTVTQFAELQNIALATEISRIVAGNNVLNSLFMVVVSLLLMIFYKLNFPLWLILLILGILNIVVGFVLVYCHRQEIFDLSETTFP
jgi:MFS family permease